MASLMMDSHLPLKNHGWTSTSQRAGHAADLGEPVLPRGPGLQRRLGQGPGVQQRQRGAVPEGFRGGWNGGKLWHFYEKNIGESWVNDK